MTDRARTEADALVQVDAGDLLAGPVAKMKDFVAPPRSEIERSARLLLAGYARLGVDAITPGETELTVLGPARLAALAAEARVPIVSANVIDDGGRLVFPPSRLIVRAGVKVGIFGVLEPPPIPAAEGDRRPVRTAPVEAAARQAVAALRAQGAQIVVGLLHLPGELARAKALLAHVPGIDVAVLGHGGLNLEAPERFETSWLVEAYRIGKDVGRLDLHLVPGGGPLVDRGLRAQMIGIRESHQQQIADYRKRRGEDQEGKLRDFYDKQIAVLTAALTRDDAELAVLPKIITGSWLENRVLPLEETIADQPGMALLVRAHDRENERLGALGLPVGVGPQPARRPPPLPVRSEDEAPEDLAYAGTEACGSCHTAALAFWRTTKHAHAVAALTGKGRQKDPSCLGCHATGYLQPGGTQRLAVALARFGDVGCESCHGPGLTHLTADDKHASIRRAVAPDICLGCHTPDQTNGEFSYAAFRQAILGPGHGGVLSSKD